jgi:uncharacterized protein (DUF736 family)
MATIGAFTKQDDGSYTGAIRTLTMNHEQVTFRPNDKDNAKAPDFRIFAGVGELGAAWKKTTKDERDYLNVKLDGPDVDAPIWTSLVDAEGGHNLIWSRPDRKDKADKAA